MKIIEGSRDGVSKDVVSRFLIKITLATVEITGKGGCIVPDCSLAFDGKSIRGRREDSITVEAIDVEFSVGFCNDSLAFTTEISLALLVGSSLVS